MKYLDSIGLAFLWSKITSTFLKKTDISKSSTNGNIKVNNTELNVYTHPSKHEASDIDGLLEFVHKNSSGTKITIASYTSTDDGGA